MSSARSMPIPSGQPSSVVDALKSVWVDFRRETAARHNTQAAIKELSRLDDAALAHGYLSQPDRRCRPPRQALSAEIFEMSKRPGHPGLFCFSSHDETVTLYRAAASPADGAR